MNDVQKDLIFENWQELVSKCDIKKLFPKLLNDKIITNEIIKANFSSNDELDNKRMFFFHLQDTSKSFFSLVKALRDSGQDKLANLLHYNRTGCVSFHPAIEESQLEVPRSPVVKSFSGSLPTIIKVTPSSTFYDTQEHNDKRHYYNTRSKNKGQVLILNNYEFYGSKHEYRTGAKVDEENLVDLFTQMGFKYDLCSNKTAEEMKLLIKDFVTYSPEKESDMCFLIIMSHGTELGGETVVFGNDSAIIKTSWIEEQLNNKNCRLFREKPKVILYQVCRGQFLDLTLSTKTQTDSATSSIELPKQRYVVYDTIRTVEDMLIGFSTLHGFKAHRDPVLGTWYIQLICEIFMESAHNTPIDELLSLVDQQLRQRMSENWTMQTSEISHKGFKRCYIHPGVYEEDGELKTYNNNNNNVF